MKEFFVGLMTLILMATFIGIGSIAWIILIPVLLVMGILLRVVLVFLLAGLAVWLLGKFVLYIMGKLKTAK